MICVYVRMFLFVCFLIVFCFVLFCLYREMCYYKGRVRGDPESLVSGSLFILFFICIPPCSLFDNSASTCDGIDAMVWSQGQHYVINPAKDHPAVMSALKE